MNHIETDPDGNVKHLPLSQMQELALRSYTLAVAKCPYSQSPPDSSTARSNALQAKRSKEHAALKKKRESKLVRLPSR